MLWIVWWWRNRERDTVQQLGGGDGGSSLYSGARENSLTTNISFSDAHDSREECMSMHAGGGVLHTMMTREHERFCGQLYLFASYMAAKPPVGHRSAAGREQRKEVYSSCTRKTAAPQRRSSLATCGLPRVCRLVYFAIGVLALGGTAKTIRWIISFVVPASRIQCSCERRGGGSQTRDSGKKIAAPSQTSVFQLCVAFVKPASRCMLQCVVSAGIWRLFGR